MPHSELPSHVSLADNVIYSSVGTQVVLLHLTRGLYYSLNRTGARVWTLLEKRTAPADIRDALAREYDIELDACTADLSTFFRDLESGGLIEVIQ